MQKNDIAYVHIYACNYIVTCTVWGFDFKLFMSESKTRKEMLVGLQIVINAYIRAYAGHKYGKTRTDFVTSFHNRIRNYLRGNWIKKSSLNSICWCNSKDLFGKKWTSHRPVTIKKCSRGRLILRLTSLFKIL